MLAEVEDIPMTDDKSGSLSPMDVSAIQQALERMFPKSLDDIVRRSRDRFQIGLATAEELALLAATVEDGPIRDTIAEWRIIAFRPIGLGVDARTAAASRSRLSLLGRAVGLRCPWITSEVREIDIDAHLVRTRNSLYRLGARGEGEPPQEDLICVCAATYQWGFGALIGAPAFFY
jgi:hypothetical protein